MAAMVEIERKHVRCCWIPIIRSGEIPPPTIVPVQLSQSHKEYSRVRCFLPDISVLFEVKKGAPFSPDGISVESSLAFAVQVALLTHSV